MLSVLKGEAVAQQGDDDWSQFYDPDVDNDEPPESIGHPQSAVGTGASALPTRATDPRRGMFPLAYSVVVALFLGFVVFGLFSSVRVHARAFADVSGMMAIFGAGLIMALIGLVWAITAVARNRNALSWIALATALLLPVGTVVLAGGLGLQVLGENVGDEAVRFAASAGAWGSVLDRLLEFFQ